MTVQEIFVKNCLKKQNGFTKWGERYRKRNGATLSISFFFLCAHRPGQEQNSARATHSML